MPTGEEKKVGGGAEAHARNKQFDYRANSSLVLTTDRTRDSHEPSGEPESLWGKIDISRMGDRVQHGRPDRSIDKHHKKKKRYDANDKEMMFEMENMKKMKKSSKNISVLDVDTFGFYRPRTRQTRQAYEALLAIIQREFGDQPQDVICGAADEVLTVLKNEKLQDPDRHRECEKLLGDVDKDKFAELVALGKWITDFVPEDERFEQSIFDEEMIEANEREGIRTLANEEMETEIGVAVEFEDEEDGDDEREMDEIMDEEESEEDEDKQINDSGKEEKEEVGVQLDIRTNVDAMEIDENEMDSASKQMFMDLNVQEIDAYWLQRRISKVFDDLEASACQKLAEEVFLALQKTEVRDVENALCALLQYEKFDLIKELVVNQQKIVWCMKLARAQNEEEKREIEEEMGKTEETKVILDALKATRASARERQSAVERSIREEARRLKLSVVEKGNESGEGINQQYAHRSRNASSSTVTEDRDVSGRKMLDLDMMSFGQGGHFMSNKSCQLPEGSYRTQMKGYEEVHVPALKAKPYKANEKLVKIAEIPSWAQPAFQGMVTLNRIQSNVYNTAMFTSENILLCAPTGSGKTNVALLTILHQIALHTKVDGTIDLSAFKIIYVAPMKALVAEMVGNFGERLKNFGITVRELTGDINMSRSEIDKTQIIVTTPEKWDIITRKSGDRTYTNLVKLIIIDEIHLLHDERGPILESIVARTLRHIEATQDMIRIVALSATLPNYDDVAAFLRVKSDKGLFHFDNSYRPCPLAQQYVGITVRKPLQRFQLMNDICYDKVVERAGQQQVLIFVHSRKETVKTAKYIKNRAIAEEALFKFMPEDSASREILETEAESSKNSDLKDLLPFGFAMHHAGMARADRTLVEDLFADKHIQVLVSTATLAWGVNLPAHTVIIKGTQVYNPDKGGWDELGALDVMQMFGRAGRPQYDSFGEGIIITGCSELQFYLSLFNQQLAIESQLISKIPDHLNAEITLGTVQNLKDAIEWISYTYLYIRMLKNPELYGIPLDQHQHQHLHQHLHLSEGSDDLSLKIQRMDICHTAAMLLDKNNLIKYDRRTGNFQGTDLGKIASHYYVSYTTIATFNEHLKPTMGDIEICRIFSLADEFKHIIVREEEKIELSKLVFRVPIPIKEPIEEPSAKINVLLQSYISNLKLEGLALMSDMVYVTQSASRLMRCLFEICLRRNWANVAEKALNFWKMVTRRMWASQTPLRQFSKVPRDILKTLDKKDLPWERYYDLSSLELGELVRSPKLGKLLHILVHQFPRLELAATMQPITRSVLKIDLTITPDFQWEDTIHGYIEPFWIIVEDQDSETILHFEYFILNKHFAQEDHIITFTVSIRDPLPPQYYIKVISDRWLNCESLIPISFRNLILPEKYPAPTELLDLQPLPVSALKDESFESLYTSFAHFNPIQTQVFTALYDSDDNCLVAAPSGSGKTICAEFAMLRLFKISKQEIESEMILNKGSTGSPTMSDNEKVHPRCVYISPFEICAEERFKEWYKKFNEGLNHTVVVQLTGETQTDLKLLEAGHIIISTPERWDMLSRRWKQRKNVQNVNLFIIDELHLIGRQSGTVMEIITSRMRYISSQLEKPIRIIGLSTSVANAKDLGDWIGASSHSLFNFPPGVRPVPLEIYINGFDISNFESRMQAMSRPCYSNICLYAGIDKPVLVYVPTRKHTRLTTLDLLMYATADEAPSRFLKCSETEIEKYLENISEMALKHSLKYGIGFLHESSTVSERDTVLNLFSKGYIQVLVVSAALCWGITVTCHLVIIMGTQQYDGSAHGGSDYLVTDLLQMMGRASRPLKDQCGRCVLMCNGPRKQYYMKFLFESFPVESQLDHFISNHFVSEVVTGTIENKQDAVDYLTWTFYYRRLAQNPNFYNLSGVSHRHLSDHLSDLVENTLTDLEQSKVISIEDEMDLSALNLGMICAYYYIDYKTIELFATSLSAKTKLKGLIEILSAATEFDDLPIRPGEDEAIRRLLLHSPIAIDKPRYSDPHVKTNALLQAHFSRTLLGTDLQLDSKQVVTSCIRLIQAMVDVIASSEWLTPALTTMELSQMVVQGLWDKDPVLIQIPHFDKDLCNQCINTGVESIFDIIDMNESDLNKLLKLKDEQLHDVKYFCSRYPDIHLNYEIISLDNITCDDLVTIYVSLERELEGDLRPVDAPKFPIKKYESWWIVIGIPKSNQLVAIKRITLVKKSRHKLEFSAPKDHGLMSYTLYFMCDSYMGCDQEFEFDIDVKESKK